jgi:hypothetical protein
MGWIEDTLRDLARQRSRLAAPPPGENGPQPTGPIGGMTGGGLGGAVIGPQGGPETDSQARTLGLVRNYQEYLRNSGRKRDPLLDRVRSRSTPRGTMVDERIPAKLLGDPAQPFRVNQSGNKRKGLTFQQFELPDGGRANVYYGADGQRTVVRLPRKRKT